MSTITFDTLKFTDRLKEAGIPESQARAEAEALRDVFAEALDSALATKADINTVRLDMAGMKTEMASVRGELQTIKWMMGALVALSVANFAKQFF